MARIAQAMSLTLRWDCMACSARNWRSSRRRLRGGFRLPKHLRAGNVRHAPTVIQVCRPSNIMRCLHLFRQFAYSRRSQIGLQFARAACQIDMLGFRVKRPRCCNGMPRYILSDEHKQARDGALSPSKAEASAARSEKPTVSNNACPPVSKSFSRMSLVQRSRRVPRLARK